MWLGGTLRCGFGRRLVVWAGLGTLLGPEETPCRLVGVFLVPLPALDRLTHPVARACVARACVGVVVVVGVGVWWCVECCIVDASIFLCLVLWFVRVCCV